MKILLIRHASRIAGLDNPQLPLSPEGEHQCRRLAERLAQEGLTPAHYLSSRHVHATQTGESLRQFLGSSPAASPITPLVALTPGSPFTLERIITEAGMRGAAMQDNDCVAWILHHPRFNQLTAQMTSQRETTTKPSGAEALCLEAPDLNAVLSGAAVERLRIQP